MKELLQGNIAPVLVKGSSSDMSNHKLTADLGKTVEKLILDAIINVLKDRKLINAGQHILWKMSHQRVFI